MTTALVGVRGQRHAPAALYPRERPGTHCTGGWVGPRAGLDMCRKSRSYRDSIPGLAIAATGNQKYMQNQRLQLRFLRSWWWAVCRPKHVEQLSNTDIINSTTRLHLFVSSYEFVIQIRFLTVRPRTFQTTLVYKKFEWCVTELFWYIYVASNNESWAGLNINCLMVYCDKRMLLAHDFLSDYNQAIHRNDR
jgi:hypothetical protein